MIAHAQPGADYYHEEVNTKFEAMMPRIRLMSLHAFSDQNYELRHELTAEVIARSYAAFVRLAKQGRGELGYAVPLALFSIKQVKSGRRFGSSPNIKDVSSEYAQMNKGITLLRLDRYHKRKCFWKEAIVEDKRSGPADTAAMRIDFDAWLGTLGRRERRIAKVLAAGETTNAVAKKFRLSPSRISQMRSQLRRAWQLIQDELPEPAAAA